MNILLPVLGGGVLLLMAYRFYGAYLSRLLGIDPERPTPACELNDGRDYVPTPCGVVFSHHYASIAGAGPILGPTIALIYGVIPALFWIVGGCVFMGGVHDFTAMFASVREKGKSIAEIVRETLGVHGFYIFTAFLLLLLVVVNAAFLQASATALTSQVPLKFFGDGAQILPTVKGHPELAQVGGIASMSVIVITLFSPLLGYLLYHRKMPTWQAAIIGIAVMLVSVAVGLRFPIRIEPLHWMIVLTLYTLIAAGIPVWILLQPRDFVNVFLLYGGMALITLAAVVGGLRGVEFQMPMASFSEGVSRLGFTWPFLFVTIACGAISGFHSLVSSGTSCKQVRSEDDLPRVGYGAMLLEGFLALAVVVAVGAGLSQGRYLELVFPGGGAKANPVLAFALGVGTLLHRGLGLPTALGTVMGILMIEGFVVTTLDTSLRLNRYVLEELWAAAVPEAQRRKIVVLDWAWFNSGLAALAMFLLALSNSFLAIWPIFGSGNQLLAALTLVGVSAWLARYRKPSWFTVAPAVFMVITTMASLLILLPKYVRQANIPLLVADLILLGLATAMVTFTLRQYVFNKDRRATIPASAPGG